MFQETSSGSHSMEIFNILSLPIPKVTYIHEPIILFDSYITFTRLGISLLNYHSMRSIHENGSASMVFIWMIAYKLVLRTEGIV